MSISSLGSSALEKPPSGWTINKERLKKSLFVRSITNDSDILNRFISEHIVKFPEDIWILFRYVENEGKSRKYEWTCSYCSDSHKWSSLVSLRIFVLRHLSEHFDQHLRLEHFVEMEWNRLEAETGTSWLENKSFPKYVRKAKLYRSYTLFLNSSAPIVQLFRDTHKDIQGICEICCDVVKSPSHFEKRHADYFSKPSPSEFMECDPEKSKELPFPHCILTYHNCNIELSKNRIRKVYKWICPMPTCKSFGSDASFPTLRLLKAFALNHFTRQHTQLFSDQFFDAEWYLIEKEQCHALKNETDKGTLVTMRHYRLRVEDDCDPNHYLLPLYGKWVPFTHKGFYICGLCSFTSPPSSFLKHITTRHGYHDDQEPLNAPKSLPKDSAAEVNFSHFLSINDIPAVEQLSGVKEVFKSQKKLWGGMLIPGSDTVGDLEQSNNIVNTSESTIPGKKMKLVRRLVKKVKKNNDNDRLSIGVYLSQSTAPPSVSEEEETYEEVLVTDEELDACLDKDKEQPLDVQQAPSQPQPESSKKMEKKKKKDKKNIKKMVDDRNSVSEEKNPASDVALVTPEVTLPLVDDVPNSQTALPLLTDDSKEIRSKKKRDKKRKQKEEQRIEMDGSSVFLKSDKDELEKAVSISAETQKNLASSTVSDVAFATPEVTLPLVDDVPNSQTALPLLTDASKEIRSKKRDKKRKQEEEQRMEMDDSSVFLKSDKDELEKAVSISAETQAPSQCELSSSVDIKGKKKKDKKNKKRLTDEEVPSLELNTSSLDDFPTHSTKEKKKKNKERTEEEQTMEDVATSTGMHDEIYAEMKENMKTKKKQRKEKEEQEPLDNESNEMTEERSECLIVETPFENTDNNKRNAPEMEEISAEIDTTSVSQITVAPENDHNLVESTATDMNTPHSHAEDVTLCTASDNSQLERLAKYLQFNELCDVVSSDDGRLVIAESDLDANLESEVAHDTAQTVEEQPLDEIDVESLAESVQNGDAEQPIDAVSGPEEVHSPVLRRVIVDSCSGSDLDEDHLENLVNIATVELADVLLPDEQLKLNILLDAGIIQSSSVIEAASKREHIIALYSKFFSTIKLTATNLIEQIINWMNGLTDEQLHKVLAMEFEEYVTAFSRKKKYNFLRETPEDYRRQFWAKFRDIAMIPSDGSEFIKDDFEPASNEQQTPAHLLVEKEPTSSESIECVKLDELLGIVTASLSNKKVPTARKKIDVLLNAGIFRTPMVCPECGKTMKKKEKEMDIQWACRECGTKLPVHFGSKFCQITKLGPKHLMNRLIEWMDRCTNTQMHQIVAMNFDDYVAAFKKRDNLDAERVSTKTRKIPEEACRKFLTKFREIALVPSDEYHDVLRRFSKDLVDTGPVKATSIDQPQEEAHIVSKRDDDIIEVRPLKNIDSQDSTEQGVKMTADEAKETKNPTLKVSMTIKSKTHETCTKCSKSYVIKKGTMKIHVNRMHEAKEKSLVERNKLYAICFPTVFGEEKNETQEPAPKMSESIVINTNTPPNNKANGVAQEIEPSDAYAIYVPAAEDAPHCEDIHDVSNNDSHPAILKSTNQILLEIVDVDSISRSPSPQAQRKSFVLPEEKDLFDSSKDASGYIDNSIPDTNVDENADAVDSTQTNVVELEDESNNPEVMIDAPDGITDENTNPDNKTTRASSVVSTQSIESSSIKVSSQVPELERNSTAEAHLTEDGETGLDHVNNGVVTGSDQRSNQTLVEEMSPLKSPEKESDQQAAKDTDPYEFQHSDSELSGKHVKSLTRYGCMRGRPRSGASPLSKRSRKENATDADSFEHEPRDTPLRQTESEVLCLSTPIQSRNEQGLRTSLRTRTPVLRYGAANFAEESRRRRRLSISSHENSSQQLNRAEDNFDEVSDDGSEKAHTSRHRLESTLKVKNEVNAEEELCNESDEFDEEHEQDISPAVSPVPDLEATFSEVIKDDDISESENDEHGSDDELEVEGSTCGEQTNLVELDESMWSDAQDEIEDGEISDNDTLLGAVRGNIHRRSAELQHNVSFDRPTLRDALTNYSFVSSPRSRASSISSLSSGAAQQEKTCCRVADEYVWDDSDPEPLNSRQREFINEFMSVNKCNFCEPKVLIRLSGAKKTRDKVEGMYAHLITRHANKQDALDLLEKKTFELSTNCLDLKKQMVLPFRLEVNEDNVLLCSSCVGVPKRFSNLAKLKFHWETCSRNGGVEPNNETVFAAPALQKEGRRGVQCVLDSCMNKWMSNRNVLDEVSIVVHLLFRHTTSKEAYTKALQLSDRYSMDDRMPFLSVQESFEKSVVLGKHGCVLLCSKCDERFTNLTDLVKHATKIHATAEQLQIMNPFSCALGCGIIHKGNKFSRSMRDETRLAMHYISRHPTDIEALGYLAKIDTCVVADDSVCPLDTSKSIQEILKRQKPSYACSGCDVVTDSSVAFDIHIQQVHSRHAISNVRGRSSLSRMKLELSPTREPSPVVDQELRCSECFFKFRNTSTTPVEYFEAVHMLEMHRNDTNAIQRYEERSKIALKIDDPFFDWDASLKLTLKRNSLCICCLHCDYVCGIMYMLIAHSPKHGGLLRDQKVVGSRKRPRTVDSPMVAGSAKRARQMEDNPYVNDNEEDVESKKTSSVSDATPTRRPSVYSWLTNVCASETVKPVVPSEVVQTEMRNGTPTTLSEVVSGRVAPRRLNVVRSDSLLVDELPHEQVKRLKCLDSDPVDVSHMQNVGTNCRHCSFVGATNHDVRIHYSRSHASHGSDANHVVTCAQCHKMFHNLKELEVHAEQTHPKHPCFACGYCARMLPSIHRLKAHEKVHIEGHKAVDGFLSQKRRKK